MVNSSCTDRLVPRHDSEKLRHQAASGGAGKHKPRADESSQTEEGGRDGEAQNNTDKNEASRSDLHLTHDLDGLAPVLRHWQPSRLPPLDAAFEHIGFAAGHSRGEPCRIGAGAPARSTMEDHYARRRQGRAVETAH